MKRIAVIGPSGAGKSTLSRMLGDRTGLPVYHLDALHWQPGWSEPPREETRLAIGEVCGGEEWITDGNYSADFDLRLSRADTVIFLDFPRWRYFPRILRRSVRYYGKTRPDMGPGCPERFDGEFIRWVWTFHRHSRPKLLEAIAHYRTGFELHVLRTPVEVERFLSGVGFLSINKRLSERPGTVRIPQ